ncbi:hypothetical protein GCM10022243_26880 [Saccharothrix violaceirubra]|uniref:Uncharacterized protein n=1 Tax=Saccharothrix violaceirubra TaxID=413306 RepID=A0A7W7TCS7_9PSEU|nr:hypothetical protein [Saccharothrix violaceirubra]MBB4969390.1 hypothetical protein [Saccharothrix violaceirubra]
MPQVDLVNSERDWFVECEKFDGAAAECLITVADGTVEVYGPSGEFCFALDETAIADYRAAFDEALSLAGRDRRERVSVSWAQTGDSGGNSSLNG